VVDGLAGWGVVVVWKRGNGRSRAAIAKNPPLPIRSCRDNRYRRIINVPPTTDTPCPCVEEYNALRLPLYDSPFLSYPLPPFFSSPTSSFIHLLQMPFLSWNLLLLLHRLNVDNNTFLMTISPYFFSFSLTSSSLFIDCARPSPSFHLIISDFYSFTRHFPLNYLHIRLYSLTFLSAP
jgi:hypothetical protein